MSDPRHHPLLCEIDQLYREANGGLPMPAPGRFAKALAAFLAENPAWSLETLLACARNRFKSRGLNFSLQPHAWIKSLPNFASGPQDEWGKPLSKSGVRSPESGVNAKHEEEYFRRMERELGR